MAARAPTGSPPAARLLDLTRLFSRVGRGALTGIDRVEAAYLARLLEEPTPLFAIVRTPEAYHLLDRAGATALAARLSGAQAWGPADLRARLRFRASPTQQAARADLRRLALASLKTRDLAQILRLHLPAETAWINVGHSNLGGPMFDAVHAVPGATASVLVHDTIPLDYPEYQRPGTVEGFREKLRTIATQADLVICNSDATRADVARHFAEFGRVPDLIVSHLGIDRRIPDESALPEVIDRSRPWFIALGTIEPRKNHAFLLEIWEEFAATLPAEDIPALVIAGQRGWHNEAVFKWLDTSPLVGQHVFELGGLSDGAVGALLAGARALLMPSLAEGFGLPPAEALALGTPAIVNDLGVYREVLGNNPVYAPVGERYGWTQKILDLAMPDRLDRRAADGAGIRLPTWQEHFNLVLKVT